MKTDTNWEKEFDEKFPQNLFRKSLNWGMEDDPKKDIKVFLKNNGLNFFGFIYTESNLFGKGRALNNLLIKHRLDPEETIYIGDEVRDIEAAKKAGIKIISVSWGFNSAKLLQKAKPDFLINKPKELLQLF